MRGNVVPAVAIDARHQMVLALDGASLDDLRALLVQANAAVEAEVNDIDVGAATARAVPRGLRRTRQ